MAHTIRLTRSLDVKARCVDGRCCAACPGESCLHVLGDLIQANDEDDFLRSPRDAATRFPLPSMFMMTPSSEMALALDR